MTKLFRFSITLWSAYFSLRGFVKLLRCPEGATRRDWRNLFDVILHYPKRQCVRRLQRSERAAEGNSNWIIILFLLLPLFMLHENANAPSSNDGGMSLNSQRTFIAAHKTLPSRHDASKAIGTDLDHIKSWVAELATSPTYFATYRTL